MNPLLQARELCFRYAAVTRPVVKNVSLALQRGDFVGIVGPNGSGKSTLLRLLCGSLRPASGQVRLHGRPLKDWTRKEVARKIAVVGQEPFWNFPITVRDFVLQGRYPYLGRFGFETDEDVRFVDQALRRVDLGDLARRHVHELSAGERQRMLLARALAQQPEIFMRDEPTANLDLRYQIETLRLMRRLQRESGFAVLLVSHEVSLILDYVKRLVLLRAGSVLAEGTPESVVTPENFTELFGVPFQVQKTGEARNRYWISPAAGNLDGEA
ncbi:MAG: ABC transporter ATP-binding protein [Acidobacteria bacterium]|nr:ABC transporter ATP-binding protein [Acidobacteriota bacterium]